MTRSSVLLRLGLILTLASALFLCRPVSAKEYVIGAADVVAISVLDNRDLDTVVSVTPGGRITVPLIGDMQVAGLTVAELIQDDLPRALDNTVVEQRGHMHDT